MRMLKQTEPVEVGKGKTIGELIDTDTNPIDVLKTIQVQIEKSREWNCEAAMDAVKEAEKNLQGIMLTSEMVDMQLQGILASPLLANAHLLLKVVEQFADEWERGPEWISHDTFDMAVNVLRKARGQ